LGDSNGIKPLSTNIHLLGMKAQDLLLHCQHCLSCSLMLQFICRLNCLQGPVFVGSRCRIDSLCYFNFCETYPSQRDIDLTLASPTCS